MSHDSGSHSKKNGPSVVNCETGVPAARASETDCERVQGTRATSSDSSGGDSTVQCPRCCAQFVGIEPCPDPEVHRRTEQPHAGGIPLFGGQQPPYRSWYATDRDGRALITFMDRDGSERQYPALWNFTDPKTSRKLPWVIDQAVLRRDDLRCILGVGDKGLDQVATLLPGRTASYHVECETIAFCRDWLFAFDAETPSWTRIPRSQKRARLHAHCPPNCRKAHR